jgi:hypothetical protein
VLNADITWRSWSHAPTIANHRGVLFRDSSELCISLCSSPSVFGFRPCGPWAPPSCLDDRILTGGHSTRAGPRTVSCVALERALNFPDLSTFFFSVVCIRPTHAVHGRRHLGFCRTTHAVHGRRHIGFAAPHCVLVDQIHGITGPKYSSR